MLTPDVLAALEEWQGLTKQIEKLRTPCAGDPASGLIGREMYLRKRLVGAIFSDLKEGAQDTDLAGDFVLRATYALVRKIDWPALQAAREELASLGVSLDGLVEMKPALRLSVYRALPAAARRVVDNAMVITPASPTLEITRKKG